MSALRLRTAPALAAAAALALTGGLAACSSDSSGAAGSVAVTATDDACTVATTTLPVGTTTFAVKNEGSKVTEVYVYGLDGTAYTKVVGEVENIGPGTSRNLSADLAAGTYEVACKPGQKGDGIRTRVVVGSGTGSASSTASAAYDREVEISTDGTAITGVPSATVPVGDRVEFVFQNAASAPRILELKKPDGTVAGEVEVAAGKTGKLVLELDPAGTWPVIVEGDGVADLTAKLKVA